MGKPKKAGRPVGETIGGILVGFDQQIMRTTPPAQELVQQAAPIRGLSGEDGTGLTITLPQDRSPATPPQESPMPTTADLMDDRPDDFDVCELPLRQYGGIDAFEGRVRTVRCFEDNVLLRGVLESAGDGQVLVVDGGGSLRTALLGDMIAALAASNGWRGVVVNGCVRDVEALGRLPIGIRALGSNPRKSAKDGTGEVDVPVTFGSATFVPGAWVASDADGVVVTQETVPA
jgi:regulator of ribonuclease activity A